MYGMQRNERASKPERNSPEIEPLSPAPSAAAEGGETETRGEERWPRRGAVP
jgi:hypothetical protein